jgi:hypothetical protein
VGDDRPRRQVYRRYGGGWGGGDSRVRPTLSAAAMGALTQPCPGSAQSGFNEIAPSEVVARVMIEVAAQRRPAEA